MTNKEVLERCVLHEKEELMCFLLSDFWNKLKEHGNLDAYSKCPINLVSMTRKNISKAICSHLLRDGLVDKSQETYLVMSVMDALKEIEEENNLSKKIDAICFHLYKDDLCSPFQEQYLKSCLAEAYKEIDTQENELVLPNPYISIALPFWGTKVFKRRATYSSDDLHF